MRDFEIKKVDPFLNWLLNHKIIIFFNSIGMGRH